MGICAPTAGNGATGSEEKLKGGAREHREVRTMQKKTMQDLVTSDKEFFTVNDVCGVLGSDPQTIRICARQRPELLGFRTIVMGSRVKIPRIPFLRFMGVDV